MRIVRAFVYGSVALILAAGWAFLYWQSGTLDLAAGNAARSALAQLRGVDARWNEQLAGARFAPVGARFAPAPYDAAYAWLELQALRLPHPQLGRALGAVRAAFEEKSALLARIDAEDPLADEAALASAAPRLEDLGRVLDLAFDDALGRAERYRTWLLYYSAGVLALVALLAFELRRANAGLEQRIEERTRELSRRSHELSRALEELKRSETMLIQREKLSALGQMVAGIAHEVNTPLAYVKASLEAVQARVGDSGRLARETRRLLELVEADESDEAAIGVQLASVRGLLADKRLEGLDAQLEDGLHGIGQIAELVASLKDFSRLERGAAVPYDVHQGIETTLRIAQGELGRRSVKKLFGELPPVSCSPLQVNQVLLNLVVNAAHATSETDGTIVIRTTRPDADHVAIEVSDNGRGIAPEHLTKIFDPFFTTKAAGKGTGLGLSIAYRIIEAHGGRIHVESKVGVGTRFTVVLPVATRAALAA